MTTRRDWRAVRAEFPASARYTWLDTARAAPMARRAADEAQRFYAERLAEGDLPRPRWQAQVERVRARAAALINAAPEEVTFAASVAAARTRIVAARGEAAVFDASSILGAVSVDAHAEPADGIVASAAHWLAAGDGLAIAWAPGGIASSSADDDSLLPGILALGGALDLLDEIGASAIEARLQELTHHLRRTLGSGGFAAMVPADPRQGTAITFVPLPDARGIASRLLEAGVVVSEVDDRIRVSLHVFNTEEDVDRFVTALDSLRAGRQPALAAASTAPLVCVDLNGVLDSYTGWRGADHWDDPAPGARGFLEALRDRGCRVVVFTTRHYRGVWHWLEQHGLADLVAEVTDRKPAADVFVDDRAVCFRGDFAAALQQIDGFRAHWE